MPRTVQKGTRKGGYKSRRGARCGKPETIQEGKWKGGYKSRSDARGWMPETMQKGKKKGGRRIGDNTEGGGAGGGGGGGGEGGANRLNLRALTIGLRKRKTAIKGDQAPEGGCPSQCSKEKKKGAY